MGNRTDEILLIQNDKDHTELVYQAFKNHYHRFHLKSVSSLEEARNQFVKSIPKLVISDLYLPDGKGTDILDQKWAKTFPLVIMGSCGNEMERVMESGAIDYVVKSEGSLSQIPNIAERSLREWNNLLMRKRAEDSLKASEDLQRLIIDCSPIGISISCYDKFLYTNPAFLKMFAYENSIALKDLSPIFLFDPEDQIIINNLHLNGIPADIKTISYDLKGIRNDEVKIDLAFWAASINYMGEASILSFVIDKSAENKLRDQLQQAQKMEAIGALAGGIAHDFNNILSAIIGFTEMAMFNIKSDSTAYDNMESVLKAGNRAKGLTQQILSFTRQNKEERKPVIFKLLVKEVIKLLRASFPSTIEIHQHIDNYLYNILADAAQLHQAIMNLCTNAYHAMEETGGVLDISLNAIDVETHKISAYPGLQSGPYLHLSIRDTGHGMDKDTISRIFDPYFTTKAKGQGTGLGLSIVNRIIKEHGGYINVYSELGEGSVFDIYLPRIKESLKSDIQFRNPVPVGNEKILFVDDEKPLAQLGQQILERLGYQVYSITSSLKALDVFRENSCDYDLVITDITMPKMTGIKLTQEILAIRSDIPIILCTGFNHKVTVDRLKLLGASKILMKPVLIREMGEAVREVLDNKEQIKLCGLKTA